MYYQSDSNVSQFFCIGPLVHSFHFLSPHIFSSFISKFVLLFSFFFLPFFPFPFPFPFSFPVLSLPFFFTLLWFSSQALRAFDSFPPPRGGGGIIEEYTPLAATAYCRKLPTLDHHAWDTVSFSRSWDTNHDRLLYNILQYTPYYSSRRLSAFTYRRRTLILIHCW